MIYHARASFLSSHSQAAARIVALCAIFSTSPLRVAVGQWTQSSLIGNTTIAGLVGASSDVLAGGGSSTPDSLFLSTDNGQNWTLASHQVPALITSIAISGTSIVVGGSYGGNIATGSVGGDSWSSDTAGFPDPTATQYSFSASTVIGNTIFAATGRGVWQQTQPGAPWTPDTIGMSDSGVGLDAQALVSIGNDLFAVSPIGFVPGYIYGVYHSSNSGASWTLANGPNGATSFTPITLAGWLAVSGTTLYTLVSDTSFTHYDVYSTTNSGQSWTKMTAAAEQFVNPHVLAVSGQTVFVGSDSGVSVLSSDGSTWTLANQGLPAPTNGNSNVVAMQISGGNLIVGTFANGLWTRKLSEFGISSVSPSPVSNAGLGLAISGNPASSSSVKIIYTLINAGITRVTLTDEIGHELRVLSDGHSKAGVNTLFLDSATLEPGTYFVRVEADGSNAVKKLVVSR